MGWGQVRADQGQTTWCWPVTLNSHAVVSPVIAMISDKPFQYGPVAEVSVGGLDWKINFVWFTHTEEKNLHHGQWAVLCGQGVLLWGGGL